MRRVLAIVAATAACGCGDDARDTSDAAAVTADASAGATDALRDAAGSDAAPACPVVAACPTAPGDYALGDPMATVDACAFPMVDDGTWESQGALVDRLAAVLPVAGMADVLADLNRTGVTVDSTALSSGAEVPNVAWAFRWNDGDNNVAYWIPQGLTGSPDAEAGGLVNGRRVAIATWYYDPAADPNSPGDKGVRISVADITDPTDVHYRLMLLVEPYDDDGQASFRAIPIHAGGAVWFGDYLYVADTSVGFRVFDMTHILEVSTGADVIGWSATDQTYYAHNYKYVVPQVGRYRHVSDCTPRYSFVALDRSTQPPTLISGEYNSASAAGRVFRWALDPTTHRLPTTIFYPSEAHLMGYSHVQGAVAHDDTYYLSTSEPPAGRGDLAQTSTTAPATTTPWVDAPEDLVYDTTTDQLWGCGEATGKRYVFAGDVVDKATNSSR